jgi:DNA mismatch repair protein MutS2
MLLSMGAMDFASKAKSDLEWEELCEVLAKRALGAEAAERLRALEPAASLAEAEERMQLTAEALGALDAGDAIPAREVPAVAAVLDHVERSGVASGAELRDVGLVLAAAGELRAWAQQHRERTRLFAALDSPAELERVRGLLAQAIEPDGRVADGASPELAAARRQRERIAGDLRGALEKAVKRHADVLRDDRHVERDGRFALPVRTDAHRRVEGIVVGTSSSGATVLVEPPEVTALVNRLRVAEGDIEREEARVLARLSREVGEQVDGVRRAHEAGVAADVLAALGGWAVAARARAIVPDAEPRVDLRTARHPLLVAAGTEVVPNDVFAGGGRALVVSGPNAGGKTVALKTLGLAAWMARAGVPLPVREDSRVGWFDAVLTDIGDEQSIARSLSTFSAKAQNLGGMLERARAGTLVLLDELAGGTDPEEGSALAVAALEALVDAGAAVAVTTHYERLKQLAVADARFVNASVGFDYERMQPTFELTLGVPGASSALAVAGRFGVPAPVVERARALLPEAATRREELLAAVQRERREIAEARARALEDAARAEALRRELEEQRQSVRDQERRRLQREAAALTGEVREARARLRDLEQHLRSSGADVRGAERAIDEAARVVALGGPLDRAVRDAPPPAAPPPAELAPGTPVMVARLQSKGEVVDQSGDDVRVRVGVFTLRVPRHELTVVAADRKKRAPERPARPDTGPARTSPEAVAPIRTATNTCNLRGQRVDEALQALDRFLDAFLHSGETCGFVLHGHGTGALRQAVREHLSLSRLVSRSRPASTDEGGDAFTVFWLA